jgi:hypothetical protein
MYALGPGFGFRRRILHRPASRTRNMQEVRLPRWKASPFRLLPKRRCGLEHAVYAALDLGALEGLLADADIIQSLDALALGVDLRLVELAGGHARGEEQGQERPWSTCWVASA